MNHIIKQLEERNTANDIEILLWSDKMDLIAFSNVKGEVALHRLTWARVWNLGPPKEGITVVGMAWRPDGKILAIAYSSAEVVLVNVENKNILHKYHLESGLSCIFWMCEKITNKSSAANEENEHVPYMEYLDNSKKYLPDLPPLRSLTSSIGNGQDENVNFNLFNEQTDLNLLIVGTQDGFVHINIFGQFPCAVINLNAYFNCACCVIYVHFSDDLSLLYVIVRDEFDAIKIATISTDLFKTHRKELFAIAIKQGHLNNLITYISNVIVPIKETWETILLEMDSKLHKYASKVPEGGLVADFLDLLLFGIASDEMQAFLLHDLTEKGLKKFGQVIEMCYANIQKLLLKNVTKAAQNIIYHLSELRGMSRLEYRYKVTGLSEDVITKALGSSGAFLVKCGEMHQIINHFMINYKAFFRWLYSAIVQIMEIQSLPDMPKNTQQDINHIKDFLLNFDYIGNVPSQGEESQNKRQFTMERLGQYLNDSPLTIPADTDDNLWEKLLKTNECIRNHPTVIKRYKNYSLIQQFKHLASTIENIFVVPQSLISEQFSLKNVVNCFNSSPSAASIKITQINSGNDSTFLAILNKSPPADGIYFLELFKNETKKSEYIYFQQQNDDCSDRYQILDIKFYSVNILSVLLQECNPGRMGIIYQFSLMSIKDGLQDIGGSVGNQVVPRLNNLEFGAATVKHIEGMVCSCFAVSGSRRVSIVLSENKRKVRLYEMEAEEDDEDADMTNSTRESDTSMHEDTVVKK